MCGLFGFINYSGDKIKDLQKLTNYLARESTIRGTDATGIAFNHSGGINIVKDNKSAFKIDFKHADDIKSLIGHTRHGTHGGNSVKEAHPYLGKCRNLKFSLAHNGVLNNFRELRRTLNLPKTTINVDSYIAIQLLEYKGYLDFDSLKFMAEQVNGSFSFSILDDKNNIYLVKGDSPLSILHFPKLKIYVYASTDEILYKAIVDYPLIFSELKNGEHEKISISEGDILKIRPDGIIEKSTFEYNTYYGRDWWYYGSYSLLSTENDVKGYTKNDYIEDLKSVACFQGFSSEIVDDLINNGFTLEEIEDYIYEF